MDSNNQKRESSNPSSENQKIIDSYDYLGKACSVMDCTGLIPSAPQSRAQQESYESLYPYLPPVITPKKEHQMQSPIDTDRQ